MNDNNFYNMFQEIRTGNITQKTIETIKTKVKNYQPLEDILDTTHIVSHQITSQTINSIISTKLPSFSSNGLNEESFTSIANDFVNNEQWTIYQAEKAFMHHTNYSFKLTLAISARVMYLNNDQFKHGLYNGFIEIIIKIYDSENVEASFSLKEGIKIFHIKKDTVFFTLNGMSAKRIQFPLQNAFALTVHKTQGLTLPHITLSLDESIFAKGQAYVAMSQVPSWDKLQITSFDINSIKSDKYVLKEYERLEKLYNKKITQYTSIISS